MGSLPKTPSMSLAGKRALVTGAGRGIGMAAAVAMADAGAHVTLVSRSGEELERLVLAIRSTGGSADLAVLDVTDRDRSARAIASMPVFDILVNNAGANRPKPFIDVTVDDFDVIIDLNVKSSFFVAQSVVRRMLSDKRRGSIINVSSQMGHVGAPNRSLYCASKWSVEGLTKAMATELGEHGIRVNTLCPTFIETPMTSSFLADEAFRSRVLSKIKLGRLGQVEDIMGAIVFLASDASGMMTGSALMVDGGWTAE